MFSKTFLDFISDMDVTDHKLNTMIHDIENKNKESSTSGILFKKQVLPEVSYFARNKHEIEDLILLENNIV